MNLQSILTALSFTTASMILLIGIVLLTGVFLPAGIPVNYRTTLGSVMTLYAAYRIGILWYKTKRERGVRESGGTGEDADAGGMTSAGGGTENDTTGDTGHA